MLRIKLSVLYTTFTMHLEDFAFKDSFSVSLQHQKKMSADLKDVVCMFDNVLVYGFTYKERDERLEAVLNRLHNAGITLNKEKC